METNSQLCSFKASVYKSKPRLRRAFYAHAPAEVLPAGLWLPEQGCSDGDLLTTPWGARTAHPRPPRVKFGKGGDEREKKKALSTGEFSSGASITCRLQSEASGKKLTDAGPR